MSQENIQYSTDPFILENYEFVPKYNDYMMDDDDKQILEETKKSFPEIAAQIEDTSLV